VPRDDAGTVRSGRAGPLLLLLFLALILVVVNGANWFILARATRTLDEQLGSRLITVAHAAVATATPALLLDPEVATDGFVRDQLDRIVESHDLEDVFLVEPDGVVTYDRSGGGLGERNPFLDLDRVAFRSAAAGTAAASPAIQVRGAWIKAAYAPVTGWDGTVGAVLGVTAGGDFYAQVPALRRTLAGVSLGSAALVALLGALFFGMSRRLARTEIALSRAETLGAMGMMAAGVAHEVRNPLAIIAGTAERLRKKYGGGADDPLFTFIPEEVERLNRILEGYLRFAQDEPLQLERCDLRQVVERSARLVEDDFRDRGIALRCEAGAPPVPARADPRRLQQVLLNLLLNGAQAMPGGGELELRLEARGRHARIRVRDRGPGFSPAALRSAFQPFWTTKEAGSGLGLVLARRIVEAHGGTIAIANPESGGAEVTVDIPAHDDAKERA
jgi:signal transduction histidine kinase